MVFGDIYFPYLKTNQCICSAEKWCDNILFISGHNKFSEICASSKVFNPFPSVDLFLIVYEDTLEWKTNAESVVTNGAEEEFFEKSTKHWVGAALATDEVLKLLNAVPLDPSLGQGAPTSQMHLQWKKTRSRRSKHMGASAKVQWPRLVPKKTCKIFQIPRHIKSLDVCIKY